MKDIVGQLLGGLPSPGIYKPTTQGNSQLLSPLCSPFSAQGVSHDHGLPPHEHTDVTSASR